MRELQITLTVEEGKELISRAVISHPKFIHSVNNGKIVLKGGTTVSRIAEKLTGNPLRICGRITKRGTVAYNGYDNSPHIVIYQKGSFANADKDIDEQSIKLTGNDVVVCGANAIDSFGRAGILAGSPGGGLVGSSISGWLSEGSSILIPVGIEKMIPGKIDDIIVKNSRKGKYLSWGMSVALLPLYGEIITEIESLQILANVKAYVIACGGLNKAQGSTTIIMYGEDEEVDKIIAIIKEIKNMDLVNSGSDKSLIECEAICPSCTEHMGCGYKSGVLR